MKKIAFILFVLLFCGSFSAQTLEERIAEIDAYAQKVMTDWHQPGMAIAIVKDDKVVFAKGYGVKSIASTPSSAYRRLFDAVKQRNVEAIKQMMSKKTQEFASSVSLRHGTPLEKVFENGLTSTTFAATAPEMRNERVEGLSAGLEVFNEFEERQKQRMSVSTGGYAQASANSNGSANAPQINAVKNANDNSLKRSSWEDLPFVFEEGEWKVAIGEMFAGTYKAPPKPAVPKPIESPNVDADTDFAIASNSKAFTVASLAILVDEKKLAWNDKVTKYLPDFKLYDPYVTSELTIRDLVTHRVGLDTFSGDLLWYETDYSSDEILQRVRFLKPASGFRTQFGYSNLMFIAAGKVIEKVSGKPWCTFVTEHILSPLGMSRTTCSIKTLPENSAWPHNESGGTLRVLQRGNVDGAYSAAALNSNVNDLSKWMRLQLGKGKFEGKQIFSEAQAWGMHQPYLAQQISENSFRGNPTRHFTGVASGWFVYDFQGRKIINHSGGLDGMLSYTHLIPEENVGFVVLTNSEYPVFTIMANKIRDIFVNAPKRDWNGEALEQAKRNKAAEAEAIKNADAARVPDTKPTLPLTGYAGSYSDDLYGAVNIAEENGHLVMRFSHSPNFVADLAHWHFDTYQIKWRPSVAYNFPRGFVTFTVDKDGKTDELKIDQPNSDFWFYELHPKRVK